MALIAVLEFGNNNIGRYHKQYLVSDCHFVHKRSYNRFGPEAPVRSELLEVSVICPGRDDLNLYEWYDSMELQEGRVVIKTNTVSSSDYTSEHIVYFENARCFSLSESYDIDVSRRRILTLGIEAETVKIDDVEIKRV
jgi:hypothetical protein